MSFFYTILPVFILPLLVIIYIVAISIGNRKSVTRANFDKGLHWRDLLD